MKMNLQNKIHKWLTDVIIGLNLCPFAKDPFENNKIKIEISNAINEDEIWSETLEEIHYLEENINISTTLLAFDKSEISFYNLNDLVLKLEKMLEVKNIPYQVVAFHPEFKFQDTTAKDRINYVNRSPYPLIHILRSEEMDKVFKDDLMGEKINLQNEITLGKLSTNEIKKLFY